MIKSLNLGLQALSIVSPLQTEISLEEKEQNHKIEITKEFKLEYVKTINNLEQFSFEEFNEKLNSKIIKSERHKFYIIKKFKEIDPFYKSFYEEVKNDLPKRRRARSILTSNERQSLNKVLKELEDSLRDAKERSSTGVNLILAGAGFAFAGFLAVITAGAATPISAILVVTAAAALPLGSAGLYLGSDGENEKAKAKFLIHTLKSLINFADREDDPNEEDYLRSKIEDFLSFNPSLKEYYMSLLNSSSKANYFRQYISGY